MMDWKCRLCDSFSLTRAQLLGHYGLQHSHFSKVSPLPCLYDSCICTFVSFNALKIHVSRFHNEKDKRHACQEIQVVYTCPLCGFKQPFSEKNLFGHLRGHLRSHEMVTCPYKNCRYTTNVYSSFNSHKTRAHGVDVSSACLDLFEDVVAEDDGCSAAAEPPFEDPTQSENADILDIVDIQCDTSQLKAQLQRNLASLFLKMQAILHVSDIAAQEIVEHLCQLFSLSRPLLREAVNDVLQRHCYTVSEAALDEIVSVVIDSNVFVSATAKGAELSSNKRRKTFIERNYPMVMPFQYVVAPGRTAVYVPILPMIQLLFKHTDVLDRIKESHSSQSGQYTNHRDGLYFQENELLSASEEFKLPLLIYIDEIEVANPLGTSRKIHKLCSVYWVLADLPSKYRSALHVIQLALLCKVPDVQKCGYESVLGPLMQDLRTLEQDGVFIESLGQSLKGTVLFVAADNLAAHGLAGFVQSFRSEYVCRFCLATLDQFQSHEVAEGEFSLRTKVTHDLHVQNVSSRNGESNCGVKGDCVLKQKLQYFHPITGFPPDILHDLLEGIVPVELALCIQKMIRLKHFTLDYLNSKIESFPYQHTDKVDRPKPISKTYTTKMTIGGNGHENAALLRLLPFMVGSVVPEGDSAWAVLMELKDIVELVLSPTFTEEMIQYLQSKIRDHRQILLEVFPDFKIRPKHHYVEHYPELIRCFGPLVHLWTMRFEGKHRFFKRVVHDTQNFKNVLKTLASRHQHMMAYHLSAPAFFKPHLQASTVTSVLVSTLPEVAIQYIKQKTDSNTIYCASQITIDGTNISTGEYFPAGFEAGLPQFCKTESIVLVNDHVAFLCREHKSHYIEHLRAFNLCLGDISVKKITDLSDTSPLSAYCIEGKLLLTPKRFLPLQ